MSDNGFNITKLLEPLEKYSSADVAEFMRSNIEERIKLFLEKDKAYGASWQKDGLLGAYLNVKRKTDRLQNIITTSDVLSNPSDVIAEETILNTLVDAQNYLDMLFYFIIEKSKELNGK